MTEPEQYRRWVHLVVFIKTWNLELAHLVITIFRTFLLLSEIPAWGTADSGDSVTIFRLASVSHQQYQTEGLSPHHTGQQIPELDTALEL